MRQILLVDAAGDPTLVRLQVSTMTAQASDGASTREDFRLTLESNAVTLPQDVTKLLHNNSLNERLYVLGFRELSIQDTVGEQLGTVLCMVQLSANGAHPAYCMRMENLHYAGGDNGYWGPGWNEYHNWPTDYLVTSN